MREAPLNKRVSSGIIDYTIVIITVYIVGAFLIINLNMGNGDMQMAPFVIMAMAIMPISFITNIIRYPSAYGNTGDIIIYCVILIMMAIIEVMYFTLMEASKLKATIGYKSNGIRLSQEGGGEIRVGAIIKRNCLKVISRYLICIPFIVAILTNNKQTIYDKLTDIEVIEDN